VDGRRVLVVEDPLVRRLIHGILTRGGYTVEQAEPRRALELLRDPAQKFDLLITNVPQLFVEFASCLPVLYVAASPDAEWVATFARCRALHKPFHPLELVELTRELLENSHATAI
jgi:DNA-binding response OmpR family regulator